MIDTPVQLTYDSAVTLLRRAVMEKGADYMFVPEDPEDPDAYWYFNPATGEPGCIVGQVLAYRGVTMEDLGQRNVACGFPTIYRMSVVRCDSQTKQLLEDVQELQDYGKPWGAVVDAVLASANELQPA